MHAAFLPDLPTFFNASGHLSRMGCRTPDATTVPSGGPSAIRHQAPALVQRNVNRRTIA
jgi:hypothetical protein